MSTFDGNQAFFGGGAVHAISSKVNVVDTSFDSNVAHDGGVFYLGREGTMLEFIKSTAVRNYAMTGGVIYCQSRAISLRAFDSVFELNYAASGGVLMADTLDIGDVEYGTKIVNSVDETISQSADEAHFTADGIVTLQHNTAMRGSCFFVAIKASLEIVGNVIMQNNSAMQATVYVDILSDVKLNGIQSRHNQVTHTGAFILLESSTTGTVTNSTSIDDCVSDGSGIVYVGDSAVVNFTKSRILNAIVNGDGVVHLSASQFVSMRSSFVSGNFAYGTGSALYAKDPTRVLLKDTTFADNVASGAGALEIDSGHVKMINVVATNNFASNGGFLHAYSSAHVEVSGSHLVNNVASTGSGGAVYASGESTVVCFNTTFSNNKALKSFGGAVALESSTVLKANLTAFIGNVASFGGAISAVDRSTLQSFNGAIFVNNTALSDGGVVYVGCQSATVFYARAIFERNQAINAGGVVFYDHRCARRPILLENGGNNTAAYGNVLASGLAHIEAFHEDVPETSGKPLSKPIVVVARDALGQQCSTCDDNLWLTLDDAINASINGGVSRVYLNFQAGLATTDSSLPEGFIVQGAPGTRIPVLAQFQEITKRRGVHSYTGNVTIALRQCRVGEIIDGTLCMICSRTDQFNFYPMRDDMERKSCAECPKRATCSDALDDDSNATTPGHSVKPNSGYWRSTRLSLNIRRCPFPDACQGDVDLWWSESSCTNHHSGPLCAKCNENFVLTSRGECQDCRPSRMEYKPRFVAARCATAALFLTVGTVFARRYASRALSRKASSATLKDRAKLAAEISEEQRVLLRIWAMIKQVIVYVQINSSAQYTLRYVAFSNLYRNILEFSSVLGLDPDSLLDSMCVDADYFGRLRSSTLVPLALVGVIAACYGILAHGATKEKKILLKRKAASGILLLSCLTMTNTATIIFRTFDCDSAFREDDGEDPNSPYLGSAFVESDYRISCHSRKYKLHRIYAIEMCFVFPLGIPLVYLSNLVSQLHNINPREAHAIAVEASAYRNCRPARNALFREQVKSSSLSSEETTRLGRLGTMYLELEEKISKVPPGSRTFASNSLQRLADELIAEHRLHNRHCAHLAFLFRDYTPARWYMEIVESARRLILTCMLPSVYPEKNIGRVYVAVIFVLGFALGYEYLKPFADPDLARFAAMMHVLLLMSLFCTIVIYSDCHMDSNSRSHFDRSILDAAIIAIAVVAAPLATFYFLSLKLRKLRLNRELRNQVFSKFSERHHKRGRIIPAEIIDDDDDDDEVYVDLDSPRLVRNVIELRAALNASKDEPTEVQIPSHRSETDVSNPVHDDKSRKSQQPSSPFTACVSLDEDNDVDDETTDPSAKVASPERSDSNEDDH